MSQPQIESYRSKALIVLILVFLGGAIGGAVSTRLFSYKVSESAIKRSHEHEPSVAVDRFRKKLELNTNQVKQLKVILDHCIMMETKLLNKIESVKEEGRQSILEILTEQQRKKFDTVLLEVSAE